MALLARLTLVNHEAIQIVYFQILYIAVTLSGALLVKLRPVLLRKAIGYPIDRLTLEMLQREGLWEAHVHVDFVA